MCTKLTGILNDSGMMSELRNWAARCVKEEPKESVTFTFLAPTLDLNTDQGQLEECIPKRPDYFV